MEQTIRYSLSEGAMVPLRKDDNPGFSLFASHDVRIPAHEWAMIGTGVRMVIPQYHYGRLEVIPYLANKGFQILAGVIDEDYRGEIKVLLMNLSSNPYVISFQSEIAQLIIVPHLHNACLDESSCFDPFPNTDRLLDRPYETNYIKCLKTLHGAMLPEKATRLAAGFDLYTTIGTLLPGRKVTTIRFGWIIKLPVSTYGRLAMRSSYAKTYGLQIVGGVINSNFKEEITAHIYNPSEDSVFLKEKTRVCQLIIERFEHNISVAECTEIPEVSMTQECSRDIYPKKRRIGGFGSTGDRPIEDDGKEEKGGPKKDVSTSTEINLQGKVNKRRVSAPL